MKFLMDIDHITILQRRSGREFITLAERISRQSLDDIGFSVVSFHEQVMGCNASINQASQRDDIVRGYGMLDRTLASYSRAPVVSFDRDAGMKFDELVEHRFRVATMDLRIAAIAMTNDLILPTRNLRDFGRIPGLLTQDWTT